MIKNILSIIIAAASAILFTGYASAAVDFAKHQKIDENQVSISYKVQPGLKAQDYFYLNGAEQAHFKIVGEDPNNVELTIFTPELRQINNVDLSKVFELPGYGKYTFIIKLKKDATTAQPITLILDLEPLTSKK